MTEVILFMLGFTAITSVYEIAKSSKSNQSSKLKRDTERLRKLK